MDEQLRIEIESSAASAIKELDELADSIKKSRICFQRFKGD